MVPCQGSLAIGRFAGSERNSGGIAEQAATAQVSGEVDQVFRDMSREFALDEAARMANSRAISSGADPATIVVIDQDDIPISYLPGNAHRIRVRCVGDVAARAPDGAGLA